MQHKAPAVVPVMSRAGLSGPAMGLWLLAWLGAASCAPSEEEIQQELEDYVDGASSCSAASECAIVDAPCPLGCFVAVRADRVASVERKISELLDAYGAGGRGCVYTCVAPGALECMHGRCTTAGSTGR